VSTAGNAREDFVESKKTLIRKMAAVAVLGLVLGLAVALFTSVATSEARKERREETRQKRKEAVDRARAYLDELAGQITALPVDPTIVGEVQARYFQEVSEGRRFVWGMGSDGDFLFGVPREDFARLNNAWEAHEAAILAEGAFVDQQDFLRQLIQESARLEPSDLEPNPEDPEDTPWSELRHYSNHEGWMVLSTPLQAPDGSALGDLYLKTEDTSWWAEPGGESPAEVLQVVSLVVAGLSGMLLWLLVPTWVYVDARERGVRRALLWAFLVFISFFIGLVVYLIARPEDRVLKCPSCEREINGGAYCPHCGHDLSAAFCAACRYPLKPDWAFCPSCRTEVRTPASEGGAGSPPAPEPHASSGGSI
jgi:hypothetical protein